MHPFAVSRLRVDIALGCLSFENHLALLAHSDFCHWALVEEFHEFCFEKAIEISQLLVGDSVVDQNVTTA